jgi:hypothetical protein
MRAATNTRIVFGSATGFFCVVVMRLTEKLRHQQNKLGLLPDSDGRKLLC